MEIMRTLRRVATALRPTGPNSSFRVHPNESARLPAEELVDFTCNVCGHRNCGVPLSAVENREYPSCSVCCSSLRMRAVIYALAMELYDSPVTLPAFPTNQSISGLGMSDWEGYASRLRDKFSYVNTQYHTEPQLDITNIPEREVGRHRFLISSDVFEHIPLFDLENAFRNSRRLLQDNGLFVFTAPFTKTGVSQEHFSRLHDFSIISRDGKRVLLNKTTDGSDEIFENLIFHGGDGMTLEMRIFSEPDLRTYFANAGFSSVKIYAERVPEFGILWPMDWAVPIVARA